MIQIHDARGTRSAVIINWPSTYLGVPWAVSSRQSNKLSIFIRLSLVAGGHCGSAVERSLDPSKIYFREHRESGF